MIKLKENKGITLVALIITVIILLILAGVALSLVIGENGLITKSKQGVSKYKEKEETEKSQLEEFEAEMGSKLADDDENPELKPMKLRIKVEEGNEEIELPTHLNYKYDCEVDWGDGSEKLNVKNGAYVETHTYSEPKEYTITINGLFEGLDMRWGNESMEKALIEVEQWGATGLKGIDINGSVNLNSIATPSKNSFVNVENFNFSFQNCKTLTQIPENLFANCPNATEFAYTFQNCTSLKEIPENLFVNCLSATRFSNTFSYCTGLTSIPEKLFANTSKITDLDSMFFECKNLTSIPENLFANCSNVKNFSQTFYRCLNLKEIPENLFANCSNVKNFSQTFDRCLNLKEIPENLFVNCPNVIHFDQTFESCTNLESIPEKLFANCINVEDFYYTFSYCSNLTSIPENLFANCPNVDNFNAVFESCTSLTSIPQNLFANCQKVTKFDRAFYQCTSLTGKSLRLWEEGREGITSTSGGTNCYNGCSNLEDFISIPSDWKSAMTPL